MFPEDKWQASESIYRNLEKAGGKKRRRLFYVMGIEDKRGVPTRKPWPLLSVGAAPSPLWRKPAGFQGLRCALANNNGRHPNPITHWHCCGPAVGGRGQMDTSASLDGASSALAQVLSSVRRGPAAWPSGLAGSRGTIHPLS